MFCTGNEVETVAPPVELALSPSNALTEPAPPGAPAPAELAGALKMESPSGPGPPSPPSARPVGGLARPRALVRGAEIDRVLGREIDRFLGRAGHRQLSLQRSALGARDRLDCDSRAAAAGRASDHGLHAVFQGLAAGVDSARAHRAFALEHGDFGQSVAGLNHDLSTADVYPPERGVIEPCCCRRPACSGRSRPCRAASKPGSAKSTARRPCRFGWGERVPGRNA